MGYYLGLPRWAYEITERKAEEKVRGDVITKAGSEGCSVRRTQPDIAGIEDGGQGWGMSPGKQAASGSWKKQGNGFSHGAFRKEHRPTDLLILGK